MLTHSVNTVAYNYTVSFILVLVKGIFVINQSIKKRIGNQNDLIIYKVNIRL